MLKTIAELTSVVGKWVSNLHLPADTPVEVAITMCEEFISYLKKIKEQADANKASTPAPEAASAASAVPEPSKEASNG